MSIENTTDPMEQLLSDEIGTPETKRPRFRHAITTGASRVRAAAPPRVRQASGAVRRNPAPAAGVLALVGGTIAALIVGRRMARARAAARARGRWVPARFRR
ncbi:hypothetical protein GCM10010172_39840 [Paractinoplanes ferrugineus]|uniref:Uncharacterized protein n=1 Tax=Paractinoplanes ferrugineus TaxID=113564 RepID=A0A919J9H9_9ACTN|nr:hypothetical protein [Actinoplanes ferrugineus]GIE16019.1 hypothetical protein Afe05nite_78590 [Actinoplanes ferrugineus]